MEAVYNWSIKKILAKPVFTDKHGNVRENVLKRIVLEYKGTKGEEVLTEEVKVTFSLIDLNNFTDHTQLTSEQVLEWAHANMKPGEKERTEEKVQRRLERTPVENSMVEISL
jgi:hypothetical protein